MKSILFATAMVLVGLNVQAKDTLVLSDGKIFLPLKGSPATAGYGTFANKTNKAVQLVIRKADPFKAVEMHRTLKKDGRMAMEKVDTWTVPANGTLELKPGGNHIMLFDPTREVKADEQIKVSFQQDGENTDFTFKVVPRAENSGHHSH